MPPTMSLFGFQRANSSIMKIGKGVCCLSVFLVDLCIHQSFSSDYIYSGPPSIHVDGNRNSVLLPIRTSGQGFSLCYGPLVLICTLKYRT